MEESYKPVPDVECLKYHGTPEKPDIKIFVSHRIDLDSETIDNPLYIPVRCGAVYDKREGVTMLGDDTGDNISDKRLSFSELTVQYWAWKNVEADYYGMCHYRRYLSFSEEEYPMDASFVHEKYITQEAISRYGLLESVMREEIEKYDAVISTTTDMSRVIGAPKSNYLYYTMRPRNFDGTTAIDLLSTIVKEKYPEYAIDTDNYFSSSHSTFCNCYIMKKEIFFGYNQWLFDILFEFEKRLDTSNYNLQRLRAPAFMSEPLFGIYFMHQQRMNSIKVSRPHQIVFFDRPEQIPNLAPAFAVANISIVIPSSDYYAPYSAVCLKSILCHISEDHNYDFIILSADMSEQNKQIIKHMECGHENVSIRFYNPEPLIYPYKQKLQIDPRIDLISFYRVAMPYFLLNYEKVICIDSDLVLETDIAELDTVLLGDNYIAGVSDVLIQGFLGGSYPKFMEYRKKSYSLKNMDNYINTGVAVYNLTALRERYSFNETMDLATKQYYMIQEQDVINLLVEGHSILIDERWNVFSYNNGVFKRAILDYAPYRYQQQYLLARKSPCVVHWAGAAKPWIKPDDDLADHFWFYARMSPLYEVILHRLMWDVRNYKHPAPHIPQSSPYRSAARKLADRLLPKGSRRRNFAKKILPKGSRRWDFCKKIYCKMFKR